MIRMNRSALAAALAAASLFTASAHAALFEDEEARRAILDLRQQVQQQRDELRRANEDNATLRRSLLELLGVRDAQGEAVSFGKEKPAVQGNDESAWAQNRRAEIAYR